MTHDPMCPALKIHSVYPVYDLCECKWIHEMRNAATAGIEEWKREYRSAVLQEAVEAVKTELSALKPLLATEYKGLNARDGAQEAENHAVAAIEALGGTDGS